LEVQNYSTIEIGQQIKTAIQLHGLIIPLVT